MKVKKGKANKTLHYELSVIRKTKEN